MAVSTFLMQSPDVNRYSMTDAICRPIRNVPLDDVIEWSRYDPLWKHRGQAIQAYAELESSLCFLLKMLGEMSWETAETLFYKITSTGARNAILDKLLHKKAGTKFNAFWNPYLKELRPIDLKRNEIVHWLAVANVFMNDTNQLTVGVTLVPPGSVKSKNGPTGPHITSQELMAFATKCDEFARLASGLAMRFDPETTEAEGEPWLDIYQLPLVYPLPAGHPIIRKPPEPEIHPRSFPESLQFLRPTPDGLGLVVWNP